METEELQAGLRFEVQAKALLLGPVLPEDLFKNTWQIYLNVRPWHDSDELTSEANARLLGQTRRDPEATLQPILTQGRRRAPEFSSQQRDQSSSVPVQPGDHRAST